MSPENKIVIDTKRKTNEVIWGSITSAIDITSLEEVAAVEAELLIFLLASFIMFPALRSGADGGLPAVTSAIVLAS